MDRLTIVKRNLWILLFSFVASPLYGERPFLRHQRIPLRQAVVGRKLNPSLDHRKVGSERYNDLKLRGRYNAPSAGQQPKRFSCLGNLEVSLTALFLLFFTPGDHSSPARVIAKPISQEEFWIACEEGDLVVVRYGLISPRVDVNQPIEWGLTPLYLACEAGHIEVVKLLLDDLRVQVNQVTGFDTTPLYVACEQGHSEVVALLLKDPRVNREIGPTWFGTHTMTPKQIAKKNGHNAILALFECEERTN